MAKITRLKRYKNDFEKAKAQMEKKKEELQKAETEIFSRYGRLKFEELQLQNGSRKLDIDEVILEQIAFNKELKNKLREERKIAQANQKNDFPPHQNE